ncbi:MAG: AAA family ATPase [Parcubacteria group bacterium CG1_02_37_51]|uniref:Replication-associated recombination protein A n=2 Tax=Candidatus Komeiliibacteriota TaxID=1817908 RepID=A0A2M8DQH3_9BACT|nr:MAG: AAA family ATPase [Parcubacteria group bacterium CG1_02_37_51]PIY94060.1 MAG: AAA family ATPase [Candidatus Komeilibacteria bacterium CG_4_10_14_0_8_um_filter_37_78]PJC01231.1 MAG: AAA family ATPase [Candidatus Komeilibacteria bacterium CG_4_9_14_0_8_um_filter_36_9]
MDLFSKNVEAARPLADRMRATDWTQFFGQKDIVDKDKILRQAIAKDQLPSMIFWGPPGTGKTTLASIIANKTNSDFVQLSAVSSGKKDLLVVVSTAEDNLKHHQKKTILFIDEVHRWNKAQQDALLPHVERGIITLIGATTENPSFEVISALLSRCRVFVLSALSSDDIVKILNKALKNEEFGLGKYQANINQRDLKYLAALSAGDARVALNALEFAVLTKKKSNGKLEIVKGDFEQAIQNSNLYYDKNGEEHYNIISALHKSMRGSDADAALYYLGRMLEVGEKPLYVARRLIRFASEDIGLANSQALVQTVAAYEACHYIGMPECELALAQAVVYMAKCKKSNELYVAYGKVKKDVKETMHLPVPLHIRNAPIDLMKDIGYGQGYQYSPDHDYQEEQTYLPEKLKNRKYLKQ